MTFRRNERTLKRTLLISLTNCMSSYVDIKYKKIIESNRINDKSRHASLFEPTR